MPQPSFKPAVRQQESLLAPLEKKTLIWLAGRMPSWVNSDHLTLLGFLGMILSGVCYFLASWNPLTLIGAIACLAVNWFGDSLDGTLARVRGRQRPRYGFYVDHIVDSFGAIFLIGGLGLSDSYFFLPYHRADVSISWALPQALAFSAILLPCRLRSGYLLIVSTIDESTRGSYPVPLFCFALL